ncbi:UNVERIFIED_CONTAM: hypothetical protein FKN15_003371 [Acipenser sinensis]
MWKGVAPWRIAWLEESLNSGDTARPSPIEELCTLKKEIDNHSQVTAQAVAHTRRTDNKERPTTQVRRPLKDRKAKGSVFSKSLIPGKQRPSFQHKCKGNTIDSFRLEKLFSINTLSSTQRSYRKRNGFLSVTVLIPRWAGPSASSQEEAYRQLWYRELSDSYPMGRHIPYIMFVGWWLSSN